MGNLITVSIRPPEGVNVIVGQSHFIKTVEDIYEAIMNTAPHLEFGIAFAESSGPRLIRKEGNNEEMIKLAIDYVAQIGCGHVFVVCLKKGYPINILNALKQVPEVTTIYCASANPLLFVIYEEGDQRALLGVADGLKPLGIEDESKVQERIRFLRQIGYKRG